MTASGQESGEGDRMTANGHDELPDEQGIANAVDAIGSGLKNATGHVESGRGETGSDPRIANRSPRDLERTRRDRERSEDRDRSRCDR